MSVTEGNNIKEMELNISTWLTANLDMYSRYLQLVESCGRTEENVRLIHNLIMTGYETGLDKNLDYVQSEGK